MTLLNHTISNSPINHWNPPLFPLWNYSLHIYDNEGFSHFRNVCRIAFPFSSLGSSQGGLLICSRKVYTAKCSTLILCRSWFWLQHEYHPSWVITDKSVCLSIKGDVLSSITGSKIFAICPSFKACLLLPDITHSICAYSTSVAFQRGSQKRAQDSWIYWWDT